MLPPSLRAAFTAHDHLLTFEAILLSGVSRQELRRLAATGAVVRVRHGVYACGDRWREVTDPAGRGVLAARAASMTMGVPHVLSHDSAAHVHGLPFLSPPESLVHVTRPRVTGGRTVAGVKHHRASHLPDQVLRAGTLRVLDLARTAVDLAREHGVRVGLSACDSALRHGVTPTALREAAAPMAYWRGISAVRLALEWADGGADNPGESLARLLVLETGFGRPVTQFPVRLGDGVAWCDMAVGAHVIEFDGKVKYRPRELGGLADRDPGEVAWAERRRERALLERGLGVSRLVWDDLAPHRWTHTRTRIADEIRRSWAAGGSRMPAHLRDFADRMVQERAARIGGRRHM